MAFGGVKITLVLVIAVTGTCRAGEWSWGPDTTSSSSSSSSPSSPSSSSSPRSSLGRSLGPLPLEPHTRSPKEGSVSSPLPLEPHSRPSGRSEPLKEGETSPRFLGLNERLCGLGIGSSCATAPSQGLQQRPFVGSFPGSVPPQGSFQGPQSQFAPHPQGFQGPQSQFAPHPQGFQGPVSQFGSSSPSFQGPPSHLAPPPPSSFERPQSSFAPSSSSLPHAAPTHSSSAPVVEHHHTHIHITEGGVGGVGGVSGVGGVGGVGLPLTNPGESFRPSPPVHVQPDFAQGTLFRPDAPAYREECECVHPSFCAAHDVVARTNDPRDISNLLDARSLHADILSNATDAEEDVTTTENPAQEGDEKSNESRTRRDTLDHLTGHGNSTDQPQGRALGFAPSLAGCDIGTVCCRNPRFNRPTPQRSSCGLRHSSGITGRVKNPEYVRGDTEFGEYPWHVAIMKADDDYVCGGALIDGVHVLTAAHCISGLLPQEMKIRLGEWDVFAPTEFYSHIEVGAEVVVIHPDYYAGNLENDLAVIRMRRYVDFASNPHISPVCLPHDRHTSYEGQRCYSTGWGKNAFGKDGKYQSILKEVDLPVVNRYACQESLRHTRLGPNFFLRDGMMCAGGEQGKDTCKGDGGGPLVCEGRGGAFQLAGLVSWGIGCGHPGVPGVYVDIPFYLDWIHRITNAP